MSAYLRSTKIFNAISSPTPPAFSKKGGVHSYQKRCYNNQSWLFYTHEGRMSTPGKVIFGLALNLMIFSWTIGSWNSGSDAKGTIRHFRQTDTLVAPKVTHQVLPDYPDELRKEGVEGKVKLQVELDERGNIQNIEVIQPLHPYLDYSAAQAVLQWKFEPVLKKKKPIPVRVVLVIDFNPALQRILEENTETHRSFLPGILPKKDLQRILETERQTMFHYRIIKEEKIEGNESYVIEVQPKPGGAGGIKYAKLWIDQANFRILKSEIKGFPLKGYEDVFEEAIILKIKPVFTMTTFFHVEKEEVLFPSRSTVFIEYSGLGIRRTNLRYKTEMTYKKYKFFTVETDQKIIKKDI